MSFCGRCGSENPQPNRFCGSCGHALATTGEQPPATTPYPQAAMAQPSTAPPTTSSLPAIDWKRILVGNWLGAGLTAATALAVTGVLSTALALLAKPEDFGVDNGLTLVATLLGAAFGADLVLKLESGGDSFDAHLGMFSLTVTLLALVAAAFVFRKVTARYPKALDAVGDAARASLLLGLGLMLCAIVFRGDNDKMGRGWGAQLESDNAGIDASWGASIAGAFLLGFLVLFVTLVAVCFATRREWWPEPVRRVHDWLAAPLYGVGTLFAMLPVAGIVGVLLMVFTGDTLDDNDPTNDDLSAGIALIFGLLASGGFWLISLGGGAAYGGSSRESGPGGDNESDMFRLAHYAEDTPGLWAAPVVLLVLMFLAAFVVARKTSAPQRVLGNLAVWVGLLLVTLPLMSRLASMHVGISMNSEDYRASYYGGPVGWQATLLLGLVGLVCAAVVALVSGAVDRTQLRAQAGRLQANPGRPAQPAPAPWPAGQQPSGPPPGWQPGWQQQPAPQSADPWPHTPVPSHQPWPPATTDPNEGRTQIRPPTQ